LNTRRRILGIDPGSRITGFGLVDLGDNELNYCGSGVVRTAEGSFPDRLRQIYRAVGEVVAEYRPDVVAIENVFMALESGLRAASGNAQLGEGGLPVPGGSDRDNYQAALELLKEQKYADAGAAFENFLESFPDSDLAHNAQYWLAETHYASKEFETAVAAFQLVVERYPDSSKVPDALLKMGFCNYELKQFEDARVSLVRVQSEYPETTAARLAGQRLERMQSEGV